MTPARMAAWAAIVALSLLPLVATGPAGAGSALFREAEDDSLMIDGLNLTVGQVDDMVIVNATGEWVGHVDGVVLDAAGRVVALLIESENKKALVRLDEFRVDGSRLVTNITKADIQTLGILDPDKDFDPGRSPPPDAMPADPADGPSI